MSALYRVIKIINENSLIISYGINKGAKEGEKVRIYTQGEDIVDSDGNFLGTLDIIKENLEIVICYDQFSVCQKIIYETANPFKVINFDKTVKNKKKLNVNLSDITPLKYETNEPIVIGDFAEIIK